MNSSGNGYEPSADSLLTSCYEIQICICLRNFAGTQGSFSTVQANQLSTAAPNRLITAVGPIQQVLKAFDYLKEHAQIDLSLELACLWS